MIFTIIIAGGVGLAWLQLRDTRNIRDAEIVRELTAAWDSERMIEARKLVGSFPSSEAMAQAYQAAQKSQSSNYFLFTYHLNFWEQVGIAYGSNRSTLKLVDTIFGDQLWRAWANWHPVLAIVYGPDAFIGAKFQATFRKLQRNAKWKLRRREVWLWLVTPYYDVALERRRARRQRWKESRA